jgi:hypothetical protein
VLAANIRRIVVSIDVATKFDCRYSACSSAATWSADTLRAVCSSAADVRADCPNWSDPDMGPLVNALRGPATGTAGL